VPAPPQSRFDNPHGSRNPPGLLSAAEAAAFLRVKRANAVPEGPLYRGRAAIALAEDGASFENVCEWLWTGADVPQPREALHNSGPSQAGRGRAGCEARRRSDAVTKPREEVQRSRRPGSAAAATGGVAQSLPNWLEISDARPSSALREVSAFGAMLAVAAHEASRLEPEDPRLAMQILAAAPGRILRPRAAGTEAGATRAGIASTFAAAIGVPARRQSARSFEAALILCADHELTASTFAARIAASTGAGLWACLTAGLAALSAHVMAEHRRWSRPSWPAHDRRMMPKGSSPTRSGAESPCPASAIRSTRGRSAWSGDPRACAPRRRSAVGPASFRGHRGRPSRRPAASPQASTSD